MSDYNFDSWYEQQMDLDKEQIRRNGLKVQADAELRLKGLRPAVPGITNEDLAEYSRRIKHVLVLLGWSARLPDASDTEWQLLLPLCRNLVEKEQLERSVLELFKGPAST